LFTVYVSIKFKKEKIMPFYTYRRVFHQGRVIEVSDFRKKIRNFALTNLFLNFGQDVFSK